MSKKRNKNIRYKQSIGFKKTPPAVKPKKYLCVYNDEMDFLVCDHANYSIIKAKTNPDPNFYIELNFDFEEEQIFY